jgi:PAS domain S-box-containing protein
MESELGHVLDVLPGFVWTALPDGQIDFINQRWSDYTGLEIDRSHGRGWQAAVHPEDLPRLLADWHGDSAPNAAVQSEARLRGTDGQYRWFLFRAQPEVDASGQVVKWCGLSTDIDDRIQVEESLRASERRFRLIVDGLPVLLSTATANGELEQANRHYLEYFGATLEELKARAAPHSLHPDDAARVRAARRAAIDAGRPYEVECRRRGADGVYRWFYLRAFPLRDNQGRITQWYRLQTDIDEQKRAEALLAGEKQLLEMVASGRPMRDVLAVLCRLVESTASGCYCSIVLVDPSGTKLQEAIAPSLATEFNDAVREWPLTRIGGPCVMAARDKVQVITSDIASDTRWRNGWRALAQAHGLRSCWSTPIISLAGKVLGTFALYQREAGRPNAAQLELIAQFTNIASIAIARAQRDEALRQSEARLAEAERELQLMIDTIPAFVTVFGPDGEREYVNKTWRDNTGLQLADVRNGGWRTIVHPDDQERSERLWSEAVAAGQPLEIRQRIRRHDGGYRWHLGRRVPLRDRSGQILRWYSVAVDIEEQKRAEDAVRKSEARLAQTERELRLTLDSIPVITWRGDANGYVQQLNKRWFEYTGTTPEQVRGWRWKLCVHPDDLDRLVEAGSEYVTSGIPIDCEARLRRFDGTYRWFLFRPSPARDETGKIVGWYGAITDIEDRKRAEEKAVEAERELQRTIDNIPVLVGTYSADGTRLSVNKRALEATGLSAADVPGEGWRTAFHPDEVESIERQWRACLASGEPFERENRRRAPDGTYRWYLTRRVPLRDDAGKIIRWYSIGYDIEDQKRAEQALSASERNLKLIIDTMPAVAWSARADGSIEFFNQNYLDYVGLSLEQVQGWGWTVAVHPDDVAGLTTTWRNIMAAGAPGEAEARLRRHDGEYRWFLFRASPLRDEAGNIAKWYGVNTDIEDRRRTEEELRRSEAFLAKGQQASLTGTFSWSPVTEKYTWSEELYRIFDFPSGVPVTLEMIRSRYHPEDKHVLEDMAAQGRSGVADFDYEHRLLLPDGAIKYVHVVAHGGQDKDGNTLEHFGAVQDITQRRLAEVALDNARSELARVTRAMSLGALTASIAHEVNQPLAGIITNASTCLRMLAADPPNIDGARETARRTIRDGNRAADVITRLRALFSKKVAAAETLDLNEATREVLALVFSDLLRNRVVLRVEIDNDHPLLVSGDRVQLQQVILNLVRNASDAMSNVNDRPRHLLVKVEQEEDGGARLSVKDAGVGLEPQGIERLFDAFYTTKGDGMGIGLSVSRSIIESHSGKLWAEPNDGPGATFSFSIPRQATSVGDEEAPGAIWTRPTKGAHGLTREA